MDRLVIATDSTAGLPQELLEQYNIPVIPLNVHWGEDTYKDGVTLDTMTFYKWLQERDDFPMTSQPSAGEFVTFFKDIAEQFETDTIVGIFISSDLSGTLSSAILARKALPELNISLVDSRSISLGLGMHVLVAARMAQEGASAEEIVEHINHIKSQTEILFAVNTLEYLHRGGRIGGAARLLGTVLNLKPLLALEDGKVEALEKVRSRRKSLQRIVEVAKQRLGGDPPAELAIVHTGIDEDVDYLVDLVNKELKPKRYYSGILTPVVGTHCGPGAIGVTFYPENGTVS